MKIRVIAAATAAASFLTLSETAFSLPLLQPFGFGLFDSSRWLAGAVAGYNWQHGSLVYGLEGDISAANLSSKTTDGFAPVSATSASGNAEAKIDWYGTVRGRLGFATGSFLFYGTGGLAYGDVALSNNYLPGGILPALNAQASGVRAGWVAGAGIDYQLTKNLVLNFEYQYVDLGSVSLAAVTAPVGAQTISGSSASARGQFQTVTLGLSWKFAPPETAFASMHPRAAPIKAPDPWQGLYVGGRAGGAWGNTLSVTPPDRPPIT